MMKSKAIVLLPLLWLGACQTTPPSQQFAGDSAITRVENCICYASIEGQKLKPWEYAWDQPEKLRTQVSRCSCQADIDVKNVQNPARYLTPGTVVK